MPAYVAKLIKILNMSGAQYYLLLAMDMAKVDGPPPFVNACTSMLCVKIEHRQMASPLAVVRLFIQI